ncbi:MAG: holin [Pseudorhodoferax sp.]
MKKKMSAAVAAALAFLAPRTVEAEAAAAGVASKATYTGGAVSLGGMALSSDVIAWAGLVIAAAGFLVNWHYRRKANTMEAEARAAEAIARAKAEARAEQLHSLRVEYLRNGSNPVTNFGELGAED